jgi:hypothetical protein
VNVIVVRTARMRLEHHFHRAVHRLTGLATRFCPLKKKSFDVSVGEDPLHAGVRIFDQRFDEKPRALDVESKEPMTLVIECQSVGTDMNESGTFNRRAIERRHVEEKIGIASASMREVRKKDAAVFYGEIGDRQDGSRPLFVDLGCRPFD